MAVVRVEVTAEDIAKGAPHSACNCPVARAITRACNRAAAVHSSGAWWFRDEEPGAYQMPKRTRNLPKAVRDFPRRFDDAGNVEPVSFALRVPAPKDGGSRDGG